MVEIVGDNSEIQDLQSDDQKNENEESDEKLNKLVFAPGPGEDQQNIDDLIAR